MSSISDFRDSDDEVRSLLLECAALRDTLRSIGAQVARMEKRVQKAFPAVASAIAVDRKRIRSSSAKASTWTGSDALRAFDSLVALARNDKAVEAQDVLRGYGSADLLMLARELGIPLKQSKPSRDSLIVGILGKVRESILLSRHTVRDNS